MLLGPWGLQHMYSVAMEVMSASIQKRYGLAERGKIHMAQISYRRCHSTVYREAL